jgi:hypothetical protein
MVFFSTVLFSRYPVGPFPFFPALVKACEWEQSSRQNIPSVENV